MNDHALYRIERKLDLIHALLKLILRKEDTIMADLTQLTADVAAETAADQSAITLLQGLKAALDAAGTDPVALKALSDSIEANTSALSAAITANTPTSTPPVDPNAPAA